MKIENPEIYLGKMVRVIDENDIVTDGLFYGFDYDYDDDDKEFLEFDIRDDAGWYYGFTESEVKSIEVLGG